MFNQEKFDLVVEKCRNNGWNGEVPDDYHGRRDLLFDNDFTKAYFKNAQPMRSKRLVRIHADKAKEWQHFKIPGWQGHIGELALAIDPLEYYIQHLHT